MQELTCLVGPTACGKHESALLLAERIGAEIVSVDSMKVYRGLDIGSAKPSLSDRHRVPHHLIDILEPEESYNAGRFVKDAQAAINDIRARGRSPLLVGGTFLYYKALVYGMFEGPDARKEIRQELQELLTAHGSEFLHGELKRVDPATKVHPNDTKRLIRALEVFRLTGRPFSSFHTHFSSTPRIPVRSIGLFRDPKELRDRCDKRVDRMMAEGLLDEVRRIADRPLSREVRAAIGYREALQVVAGESTPKPAVESIKKRTWMFARKQLTWMRSLHELIRIDVTGLSTSQAILDRMRAEVKL